MYFYIFNIRYFFLEKSDFNSFHNIINFNIIILFYYLINIFNNCILLEKMIIKWGLGIGDWGMGIGDWAQSPIPNPQSPIPNPQ